MERDVQMPEGWHRPARIDLTIVRWRAERARRAGYRAAVIPYAGYGNTNWVRVLARVILAKPTNPPPLEPTGARGWRSFTSIPVEDADVVVRIGAEEHHVQADHGGIVDAVVETTLDPGWHSIAISSEDSDAVHAMIFIVGPDTRFGLVSDIDDTVMVTALPRPLLAAWHTFVVNEHARSTTPGMPVLYERITRQHGEPPVVYLSTGAWNVAPTLTRFLSRNLYPAGTLLLTDWGPTADRWFRSGQAHKHGSLERLAREFPHIRWLLVGDDGQHDESIYTDFVRHHPDNVAAVCIRQLSPGEAVLAGSNLREHPAAVEAGIPWLYAPDGAGFVEELTKVGLIGDDVRQPEADA